MILYLLQIHHNHYFINKVHSHL